jgi:hypothetical protein
VVGASGTLEISFKENTGDNLDAKHLLDPLEDIKNTDRFLSLKRHFTTPQFSKCSHIISIACVINMKQVALCWGIPNQEYSAKEHQR